VPARGRYGRLVSLMRPGKRVHENSINGCYMLHIFKYYCAVVVMTYVSCVVSLSLRIAPVLLVLTSFSSMPDTGGVYQDSNNFRAL
jgi:hypothetical protein